MITLTREEAQQVLDALGYWDRGVDEEAMHECLTAIKTLRARLSAPEPEPFGIWHQGDTYEESDFYLYKDFGDVACKTCVKLYTAPPQREWQGLTDEEITALKRNGERYISSQDFARAIEAKLKEKNT